MIRYPQIDDVPAMFAINSVEVIMTLADYSVELESLEK